MTELLRPLESLYPLVKLFVSACVAVAAALTVAVVSFSLRVVSSPLLQIGQWLCWYTPGAPPNAVVAGVSHGAPLLIWAAFLGLGLWSFIRFLRG